MKKSLWIAVIMVCLLVFVTGCGSTPAAETPQTLITGAEKLEDGRETGGVAEGRLGDTLANNFFAYSVNKAYLAAEHEGKAPAAGHAYLVAEITVKNIYGEPLPMWADDFQVQWGEGDEDYGFPLTGFSDSQMAEEYELAKGETITKNVVYEVPIPEDENEYSISYLEYYEDDVEGNVFFIYFDLSMPKSQA